jgi:hypothetical protein
MVATMPRGGRKHQGYHGIRASKRCACGGRLLPRDIAHHGGRCKMCRAEQGTSNALLCSEHGPVLRFRARYDKTGKIPYCPVCGRKLTNG